MVKDINQIKNDIEKGNTTIGIELGSTRIKAVLINSENLPVAVGTHNWQNSNIDGIWTYSLDEVWEGLQNSYKNLADDVCNKYNIKLSNTGAIGISGMMHGYMVFDKDGKQLVPFRTWRNTITGEASEKLTKLFNYPIPERWSIAHLYQAILNKEAHLSQLYQLTTLAGYVHWKLTGKKVMGIGEASGVFPIDIDNKIFNSKFIEKFNREISDYNFSWKLEDLMPEVKVAGENAGTLTKEGAKLLDVSGSLKDGIPLCPPEGDAGTGMVATNSIAKRTGNVSAGTSVFAMIVLEKDLQKAHSEIDLVTTPEGNLVGMAHSNNCTSDYDAWISLFEEVTNIFGLNLDKSELYGKLLSLALEGDADCGGLLSYGYIAGEHITKFEEGRPMFLRGSNSKFTLANFMRSNLFSSLCALKTGLEILFKEENVKVDEIRGHGGFFKTKNVGQKIMAAATNVPISTMETAGEGGAWGIALLASYLVNKESTESLSSYLSNKIFSKSIGNVVIPDKKDVDGFNKFFERYTKGLAIEKAAVENLE